MREDDKWVGRLFLVVSVHLHYELYPGGAEEGWGGAEGGATCDGISCA